MYKCYVFIVRGVYNGHGNIPAYSPLLCTQMSQIDIYGIQYCIVLPPYVLFLWSAQIVQFYVHVSCLWTDEEKIREENKDFINDDDEDEGGSDSEVEGSKRKRRDEDDDDDLEEDDLEDDDLDLIEENIGVKLDRKVRSLSEQNLPLYLSFTVLFILILCYVLRSVKIKTAVL